MKNLKKLNLVIILAALAFTTVSCSDDDDSNGPIIPGPPTGTDIRYEVISSVDMIDAIRYKDGSGTTLNGELSVENPLEWRKTIVVFFSAQPYNVKATVDFINTSEQAHTYTMNIYEDGELAHTINGSVPGDDPLVAGYIKVTQSIQYNVTQ